VNQSVSMRDLLVAMAERSASDLHITAGAAPTLRVHGHLVALDYPPLDGLTVPQVPDCQGSIGVRGAGPFGTAISGELRSFSSQFDDDRNTFVLHPGTIVNLTVLHPVGRRASAYVSLENLLNSDYDVGATPVRTIGQPFTFHGGLRVTLGR